MSRIHWMQDRAKIATRIPTLNRGIVENVNRGIIDENPTVYSENFYAEERVDTSEWIPARLRLPAGEEDNPLEVKEDLAIEYELVLSAFDINGRQICPEQHDEFIIKYRRDNEWVDASSRLRITGTIEEVRKRSKLYSYIIPVQMHTEF